MIVTQMDLQLHQGTSECALGISYRAYLNPYQTQRICWSDERMQTPKVVTTHTSNLHHELK